MMKSINLYTTIIVFIILVIARNLQAQQQATETEVHKVIDAWHLAAATANAEAYFGAMDAASVFIGTDASERWTKTAFQEFAMPYFKKGKAWAFKPYDRKLDLSPKGDFAWFSELLDTWMGVCRGSGVAIKTSAGWKILQYHLSVTVPNDRMKDFLQLIGEPSPKK